MGEITLTETEIINKLLVAEIPEKTVFLDRLGIPVTLKGLTGKEVFSLQDRCTVKAKKKGQADQLDTEAFNCGLIAAAAKSPNFGAQALLDKYNASSKEEVIKRLLLAGELANLGDVVLDLSGFNTDLDEVKN